MTYTFKFHRNFQTRVASKKLQNTVWKLTLWNDNKRGDGLSMIYSTCLNVTQELCKWQSHPITIGTCIIIHIVLSHTSNCFLDSVNTFIIVIPLLYCPLTLVAGKEKWYLICEWLIRFGNEVEEHIYCSLFLYYDFLVYNTLDSNVYIWPG